MANWYFTGNDNDLWGNVLNWSSTADGLGANPTTPPWTDDDTKNDNLYLANNVICSIVLDTIIGSAITITGTCYIALDFTEGGSAIYGGTWNEALRLDWCVIYGGTFNGVVQSVSNIYGGVFNNTLTCGGAVEGFVANGSTSSLAYVSNATFNGTAYIEGGVASCTFNSTLNMGYAPIFTSCTFNVGVGSITGNTYIGLHGCHFYCDYVITDTDGAGIDGNDFHRGIEVLGGNSSNLIFESNNNCSDIKKIKITNSPWFTLEKGINGSGILGML